jgi:hypothetical protein
MTGSGVDTSSTLVRATLGLRLLIEIGLFAGIVAAASMNYDGTTVWIASVVGIVVTAAIWGVFAVPNDPSRSGKTVVVTPGFVRLLVELSLFGVVTAWLVIGEGYIPAAVLGGATVVHYVSWPARIRWLLRN